MGRGSQIYDLQRMGVVILVELVIDENRWLLAEKVVDAIARDAKQPAGHVVNRHQQGRRPLAKRLAACLDVVGPQCPEIANVKPSISNDWIRKRHLRKRPLLKMLRLSRRSESALFAKCLW